MSDYIYLYSIPVPLQLPDGSSFVGQQQISVVNVDDYDITELVPMNIEGKVKYATKDFLEQHPNYNKFVVAQ